MSTSGRWLPAFLRVRLHTLQFQCCDGTQYLCHMIAHVCRIQPVAVLSGSDLTSEWSTLWRQ
jgi:hypothetical protein